jgi:predicted ArsR family transcriptional regulator
VAATRLPCRLEIQLLEKLSGRKVERTEYILDGDPCCVYQFGKELAAET